MSTEFEEKGPAHSGAQTCSFRAEDVAASQEFRKAYETLLNVVTAEEMPFERSGKHRHMWEEVIFVVEGSGHDLHWDLKFDCLEKFEWEWAAEPKRFEWKRGDFIYIPPFTNHQHVAHEEARLIVISNRIVKEMGFDWFDQVENAPGFEPEPARS